MEKTFENVEQANDNSNNNDSDSGEKNWFYKAKRGSGCMEQLSLVITFLSTDRNGISHYG